MKKILTLLAGIVFLIAILVADGCNISKKENGSTPGKDAPAEAIADSKKARIYLKDTLIDGSIQLLMHNEKHPDRKVINDLVTNVYPGDTVIWKKAHKSNIDKIKLIRIVEECEPSLRDGVRKVNGNYELVIPSDAKPDIAKYEILFTVKQDATTHTIDPYLRIR